MKTLPKRNIRLGLSSSPNKASWKPRNIYRNVGILLSILGVGLALKAITSTSTAGTTVGYITIANRQILPGQIVSAGDLSVARVTSANTVGAPTPTLAEAGIIGRRTLYSIESGQTVSPGEVVASKSGNQKRLISFAIPISRALNGEIVTGDRIDIYGTAGQGTSAVTTVLGRNLVVEALSAIQTGVSAPTNAPITITVAVPDSMTALAIANGTASQTVSIDLANQVNPPNDPGTYAVNFAG
ncbi:MULTISPECIES: hypothetical protein [Acidithrix]|uniref:SAF domain-containing protein n=1 Tax=Acidithrix ferrooxidans TaxID=1280514 RepID=A0A0D8HEV9_9ACTN|nr:MULTISPECIES: hypothetical protein [Acidithrix]KJF16500.1 hypothetical protein AXFE_26650 [Acidithrix ferrooxidans]CAG4928885.1 unnamed protein product [Acidithrix sp. C25]